MNIKSPIKLGSKEWKQVCGDSNFSHIVKLSDSDKRRLIKKLLDILGEDGIQVTQPKQKRSTKKRKYNKHSKTVELFESYYSPSQTTKVEAYEYVAKQLNIKPNSVREAIRRFNAK